MNIRTFDPGDTAGVIELWARCGLVRPWNDPQKDITRKLADSPDLFLVGTIDEKVCASAMAGYDGHRGWVNYLAVEPSLQNSGLGRKIMEEVESRLVKMGCPKINVQIRTANLKACGFYQNIGYLRDDVVGFGKRLIED